MRGAGAANEPEPRRESPNCSQQSLEALLRGEVLILPEFLRGNSGAAASALPGRVCAARCPSPSTPRSTLRAPQPARTRPLTSELPALPTPSGHGTTSPPWLSPQPWRSAVGSALSLRPTWWDLGTGGPAVCPCPLHSGLEAPVGHCPGRLCALGEMKASCVACGHPRGQLR